MCKPASFICVKGATPKWSKYSDSHEVIRKEHNLPDNSETRVVNVQVEITPPDGDMTKPVKDWVFHTDQDMFPSWWDAKQSETEVRQELEKWIAQKVITKDCAVLKDGEFYVYGGTIQYVEGGTIQSVEGGTIQYVEGGTIQSVKGGTIQYVEGGTIQSVKGGTIQSVRGGTIQSVKGGTIQYVEGGTIQYAYGGTIQAVYGGTIQYVEGGTIQYAYGGTIIVYTATDPTILKSSKAVMIDRSGKGVVCHVGKDKK